MLSTRTTDLLRALRLNEKGGLNDGLITGPSSAAGQGEQTLTSREVATGETLGKVTSLSVQQTQETIAAAKQAYSTFRHIPAPKRGEVLRQIRVAINDNLHSLGALVSLEMGKVNSESQRPSLTPH